MGTITTFLTNEKTHQFLDGHVSVAENQLDFATTPRCSGDVIQALNIPNGALVIDVKTHINTVEGGAATGDVGDGTDPNGYNDAVDLNNSTEPQMESVVKGTDAYAHGVLYEADDTIDLTLDQDTSTAIVDIYATYTMIEKYVP